MGKYNEELVKAGVILAAKGCSRAARARACASSGDQACVIDGPFAETKELIAGLLAVAGEVEGRGHRVGQALPEPDARTEAEIEIRQVFERDQWGQVLNRARPTVLALPSSRQHAG